MAEQTCQCKENMVFPPRCPRSWACGIWLLHDTIYDYIEFGAPQFLRRRIEQGLVHPDRLLYFDRNKSLLELSITSDSINCMMVLLECGADTNPPSSKSPVLCLLNRMAGTPCPLLLERQLGMARVLKAAGSRLPGINQSRLTRPSRFRFTRDNRDQQVTLRKTLALFCSNPLSLGTLAAHRIRDQLRLLGRSRTTFAVVKENFLASAVQNNILPRSIIRSMKETNMLMCDFAEIVQ